MCAGILLEARLQWIYISEYLRLDELLEQHFYAKLIHLPSFHPHRQEDRAHYILAFKTSSCFISSRLDRVHARLLLLTTLQTPAHSTTMTSTIGIPIKLLNEAQVSTGSLNMLRNSDLIFGGFIGSHGLY